MLGGFKVAQLVSVGLFIIGLLALMILTRKSKFEDLYHICNFKGSSVVFFAIKN